MNVLIVILFAIWIAGCAQTSTQRPSLSEPVAPGVLWGEYRFDVLKRVYPPDRIRQIMNANTQESRKHTRDRGRLHSCYIPGDWTGHYGMIGYDEDVVFRSLYGHEPTKKPGIAYVNVGQLRSNPMVMNGRWRITARLNCYMHEAVAYRSAVQETMAKAESSYSANGATVYRVKNLGAVFAAATETAFRRLHEPEGATDLDALTSVVSAIDPLDCTVPTYRRKTVMTRVSPLVTKEVYDSADPEFLGLTITCPKVEIDQIFPGINRGPVMRVEVDIGGKKFLADPYLVDDQRILFQEM